MCCPALLRACGNHSDEAERSYGIGLKLFGFTPEPVFTFIPGILFEIIPESRSSCPGIPTLRSPIGLDVWLVVRLRHRWLPFQAIEQF